MLLVNLKAYSEGTGERAAEVGEALGRAAEKTDERVIVAPQPQDMFRVQEEDVEVFAQHVDGVEPGSHTGSIEAGSAAELCSGTLLNHSEDRMDAGSIEGSLERCGELGLTSVVCAQTPEECEQLSGLDPDYIAFEPPELIGGDTSVAEAEPGMIEEAVERSSVPVLTGAGIKSREDVEKSIELGCEGVLVASGVVKAEDVLEEAVELCRGL
jgi:triosephosphate isomerase